MGLKIEDYALIGDCRGAGLVGNDGSIDWLCLPRFDSPACFAKIVGTAENGRWLIQPSCEIRSVHRRYRGDTLVLETTFVVDSGEFRLIDFMPMPSGRADVTRIVEGVRGEVPVHMEFVLRTDYGSVVPWVRRAECGITAIAGPDSFRLQSPVPLTGRNFATVAAFTIREGQRLAFDLTWQPSHLDMPEDLEIERSLESTLAWWEAWVAKGTFQEPWREAVVRSLITLKALTYSPSGGIVAAATTSLPAEIGGVRNWDYRYCWLRDATFTLLALLNAGYEEEAHDWQRWLLRAAAGKPEQLRIMYGLLGERRLDELELPWLSGYENSQPVRIGNGAHIQHQLDVFGEVVDALHQCRRAGMQAGEGVWNLERTLVCFLETAWEEPDEGIWEVRGPRRHFTHSKMMAWVALDRAIRAIEEFGLEGPLERWRAVREKIHRQVCEEGFNSNKGAFVQYYGSELLDASLLMMPLVGFLPASDSRVAGTVDAIERELMKNGFVSRYTSAGDVDGLPEGEASFLMCSFWMADNLQLLGRTKEACAMFERLLAVRNDVGLLSEGYDVQAHRLVGNFPQAFSHIGLVNTARNLSATTGPVKQRAEAPLPLAATARRRS